MNKPAPDPDPYEIAIITADIAIITADIITRCRIYMVSDFRIPLDTGAVTCASVAVFTLTNHVLITPLGAYGTVCMVALLINHSPAKGTLLCPIVVLAQC